MVLDIAKLFWDEKTKTLKKGRALVFPLLCLTAFLLYLGSVEAYAMAKEFIETKVEGEHQTLHTKVDSVTVQITAIEGKVDAKVPLTADDVQEQLDTFRGEQVKLYQDNLASQSKIFEIQSTNTQENVKTIVDIVLTKQDSLATSQLEISQEVGKVTALIEQQAKQNEQQSQSLERAEETAQKDRNVVLLLQKNQNRFLMEQDLKTAETEAYRLNAQQQQQLILRQLEAIQKKLESDL